MSYSMIPYAVDVQKLKALVAARDDETFDRCAQGLPTARIEAFLHERLFGGPAPSPRDPLRDLLFGEEPDQRAGSAYFYVYEHLCGLTGRRLENEGWTRKRVNFPKDVGSMLFNAGVVDGFQMEYLTGGRSPIWLPRGYEWSIDKFPMIGFIDEGQEMLHALYALTRARSVADSMRPAMKRAIEDLQSWVARCVTNRKVLACFYYET